MKSHVRCLVCEHIDQQSRILHFNQGRAERGHDITTCRGGKIEEGKRIL